MKLMQSLTLAGFIPCRFDIVSSRLLEGVHLEALETLANVPLRWSRHMPAWDKFRAKDVQHTGEEFHILHMRRNSDRVGRWNEALDVSAGSVSFAAHAAVQMVCWDM